MKWRVPRSRESAACSSQLNAQVKTSFPINVADISGAVVSTAASQKEGSGRSRPFPGTSLLV